MASFFGEVLPTFSRAVEDFEEDEDFLCHKECKVHWSEQTQEEINKSSSKTLECSTFILACGPTATAFAEAYLVEEGAECLGAVSVEKEVDFQGHSNNHSAVIHRLRRDRSVFVCRIQNEILPEQAFGLVSQILTHIPKTAILVALTTQPAVDYRGDTSSPVLRALVTSEYKSAVPCSFIETPNIVSGISAQVMTHCQIEHRPAVIFVLYMENMYFDSSYVNQFKQCFTAPPLSKCALIKPTATDAVQKKADTYAQSHNIYI